MTAPGQRDFIDIIDFSAQDLRQILRHSAAFKTERRANRPHAVLAGKMLAMIFEHPSTRTRVSFDVAMRQLGGETLVLKGSEMQINRGESVADTARVLSRYVDAIMIRTPDHSTLQGIAEHASVPVINGLTGRSHPCQVMADILTFEEHRGAIGAKTIAWVGDSNNMLTSWVEAAARFGFSLRVGSPLELAPSQALLDLAAREGVDLQVTSDAFEAVHEADCVVTDTWVSMGDDEASRRQNLLQAYQVNERLMAAAAPDAIFMHCLPAHRGEEVTAPVIDGPQSVVFDEAENRLHVQKAILAMCLGFGKFERQT